MRREDEQKRIERWLSDSEDTLKILKEKRADFDRHIETEEKHIANYKQMLSQFHETSECRYSKAMNQPSPRLCIDCGRPEVIVFVQTELQQRKECNHLYSRSMDQPYPRLCELCHEPEPRR